MKVLPEDIPAEMIEHLNTRAGMAHSPRGSVITTLAELLTMWEEHRIREATEAWQRDRRFLP